MPKPSPSSSQAPKSPAGPTRSADKAVAERMKRIKHKIVVMSGKGGVGKSTVAVNLATALAMRGHQVGILDADIHGPNVPKMLDVEGERMMGSEIGLTPVLGPLNIRIASMGLFIQDPDTPIIWRGPLKMRVISELLSNVTWGELDFLIIDLPPGTGDESLSVMQLLPDLEGVVIVVTPQEVALLDSRKAVTMVKKMKVPVLGLIENMSGFYCPHCGERTDIFGSGGGRDAAKELNLRFLGALPFDHRAMQLSDEGKPFIAASPDTPLAKAFDEVVERLLPRLGRRRPKQRPPK